MDNHNSSSDDSLGREIHLNAQYQGMQYAIPVHLYNSLAEVKQLIELYFQVPAANQRLLFANVKPSSISDDNATLLSLGIKDNHKLMVSGPRRQSSVSNDNNSAANNSYDDDDVTQNDLDQDMDEDTTALPLSAPTSNAATTHLPDYITIDSDDDNDDVQVLDTTWAHPQVNGQPNASVDHQQPLEFPMKELFEAQYGPSGDSDTNRRVFFEADFDDTFAIAKRESKFMLCVMYDARNEESVNFCRELILSEFLIQLIEQNFVMWCIDVNQRQQMASLNRMIERNGLSGAELTPQILPFMVILSYIHNSISINDVIQGYQSMDSFLASLLAVIETHGPILERAKAEKDAALSATNALLQEQNRAYEEALQKDREREQQAREEVERKRREEEAQRQREEQIRKDREVKAQRLPSEPESTDRALTTRVMFRMPDGQRVERRFRNTETVQTLFDFLDVKYELCSTNLELVANFPTRTFTLADAELSLHEAQLTPQAALFVQLK